MPLVLLTLVFLVGGAFNAENARQAGHPVESFKDVKEAVKASFEEVKSRDKFVSHKLND